MSGRRTNIHGTAIVVATTGLLFVGPSGSGKSMAAHACLSAARARGLFSALVADDQVFVSRHGDEMLAERPETIRGLMELRGTGIARLPSLRRARLDRAILVGSFIELERLPPEDEWFELAGDMRLPLLRLPREAPSPLDWLAHFVPVLGCHIPVSSKID